MVLIQNLEQIRGELIHDSFLFFSFNGLTDSAPGLCSKGPVQNPLKSILVECSVLWIWLHSAQLPLCKETETIIFFLLATTIKQSLQKAAVLSSCPLFCTYFSAVWCSPLTGDLASVLAPWQEYLPGSMRWYLPPLDPQDPTGSCRPLKWKGDTV